MPEMTVGVEFSVYCSVCGYGLCNQSNVKQTYKDNSLYVTPCPNCLEKAKSEGYDEGYDARESEGNNNARS